jgi:hypothetical protein
MTEIIRLKRDHRYWRLPQCEHDVNGSVQRWRDHDGKNYKCKRKALWQIDGKKLCELHAGNVLLIREWEKHVGAAVVTEAQAAPVETPFDQAQHHTIHNLTDDPNSASGKRIGESKS